MCTVTTFLRHNCTYLGVTASPKVVLTGCAWQQRYKKGKQRKQGLRVWVAIVWNLTGKKYWHNVLAVALHEFWLSNFCRCKCTWTIPVPPFSNVRNVGSGPRSLPLSLSRLASFSHSHSLRNKYPLSLRNIEACVDTHTIAKSLSNPYGPDFYVIF